MSAVLYVVGTPIGNLGDLSPRAIDAFENCDFIAAEDTRVTLKLLNSFGIKKPMISYHEHNRFEMSPRIVARLMNGESCALVTDAGMPAISDPGEDLVRMCHEHGIKVESVPGPTAFATAMAISGMPSGRFTFEGFLSVNKASRTEHIQSIVKEPRTMIFYEAPHKIGATLRDLAAALGDHSDQAAEGIMTTDTHPKEIAVQFTAGGKTCTIGGIAKGSGMIHPNLATMLVFLTTDCAVSPAMLQAALSGDVQDTFNMVSIDGDTSTNDMVAVLANGLAGNAEITAPGADFTAFCSALNSVTVWLCRQIAGDGEGATRLLECCVTGAADHRTAKTVAKSIICSSLVKAAMFGADANWGRVLCAIGYSGAPVNVHKVDVAFRSAAGTVRVCVDGAGIPFSEEEAKKVLLEKEIEILVDLKSGDEGATAWGCDLTYDYVKINGDYRT